MSFKIKNLKTENREIVEQLENFSILEYAKDVSVSPYNATTEYFMTEMGVKRRHLVVKMDGGKWLIPQVGAMQCISGDINATTGVKGVGDLFGKMVKGAVTNTIAAKAAGTRSNTLGR